MKFMLPLVAIVLISCHDDSATGGQESNAPIAFTATVAGSETATRADGSLVNRKETQLAATSLSHPYTVGIFGAFTGQDTWAEYKLAHGGAEPPADFFFNQEATVEAAEKGVNLLSYAPQRFWSNNKIGVTDNREYTSFWAYYPYNPVGDPGTHGIAITTDDGSDYKVNNGMGSLKYTMHPDAAEQSDFLLSDLAADCNRSQYPLQTEGGAYSPTPVPLRFHHMLAQVRIYAFIRATDRISYAVDGEGNPLTVKSIDAGVSVTLSNDVVYPTSNAEIVDAWGVPQTLTVGDAVPDDTEWLTGAVKTDKTQRWKRTSTYDKGNAKKFAETSYSLSLNNIYTSSIFTPSYATGTGKTTFSSAVQGIATGSATVSNYVPNPYWFLFSEKPGEGDRRVMLNDDFMYDYFEDAPSKSGGDDNALGYVLDSSTEDPNNPSRHFNYATANVLLVVPQQLTDEDVPHIIIQIKGKNAADESEEYSAKVTVNMLQMNLHWESGFIYCYAFVDELMPGDDKVRGPETITVVFDPTKHTDQW